MFLFHLLAPDVVLCCADQVEAQSVAYVDGLWYEVKVPKDCSIEVGLTLGIKQEEWSKTREMNVVIELDVIVFQQKYSISLISKIQILPWFHGFKMCIHWKFGASNFFISPTQPTGHERFPCGMNLEVELIKCLLLVPLIFFHGHSGRTN